VKVAELVPGMVVAGATYVAQAEHPLFPGLRLVVWRLPTGKWSHDALDARQEVGNPDPSDAAACVRNLRAALLGGDAIA